MADIFDRIRGRAATVIAKFGNDVSFRGTAVPATLNEQTGVWSDPVPAPQFSGKGIQTAGDPEEIGLSADLLLLNPIIIRVAAQALNGVPRPEMIMTWAGVDYTVRQVRTVGPNGNPIYYVVVGLT